jgi:hypothetical protein
MVKGKREKDDDFALRRMNEEQESFSSLLSYHLTKLQDKINALKVINNTSLDALENYLDLQKQKMRKKIGKLNKEEKDEYEAAGLHMIALSTPNSDIDSFHAELPRVAKVIVEETEMYTMRENIRRSSLEMILVYLITIFEEFLSNVLKSLFTKRPEILKSSKKNISYEEAFQYTNLNDLLKYISEKEVKEKIGYDIDDLAEYLSDKFGFDLRKLKDWKQFREFFYRRHAIIHNYGFPDSKYILKTEYRGNKDEWLETDKQYLDNAFRIFAEYSIGIAI